MPTVPAQIVPPRATGDCGAGSLESPPFPPRGGRGGSPAPVPVARAPAGAVARPARPGRSPLDTTTDIASNGAAESLSVADFKARRYRDRVRERYELRDALALITRRNRCFYCGRTAIADPEVRVTERGTAHFAKVRLCGAVWLCPVCGPWIRQRRAEQIDEACARWLAREGTVLLETLTLPHAWGQPLTQTLGVVRDAFRSLNSGRARLDDRDRFGLAYFIRAHDCTHGLNGWHPHLHNLLLLRRSLCAEEFAELGHRRFERWAAAVVARPPRLGRPLPECYLLEQARSRRDVSRYICKVVTGDERSWGVAMEVARGDLKRSRQAGHRTPMDILKDYDRTHNPTDRALWHEWEEATAGVHAMQWSRGLRAELRLGPEQTDEELVAVEIGGAVAYTFTDGLLWSAVCGTRGGRYAIKRAAELGYLLGGLDGARFAVQRTLMRDYGRRRGRQARDPCRIPQNSQRNPIKPPAKSHPGSSVNAMGEGHA